MSLPSDRENVFEFPVKNCLNLFKNSIVIGHKVK